MGDSSLAVNDSIKVDVSNALAKVNIVYSIKVMLSYHWNILQDITIKVRAIGQKTGQDRTGQVSKTGKSSRYVRKSNIANSYSK